ncbi:MAG: beta-hexosaminidase [Marinovum sp.]|nr:beta-hexosaminidase [Marinovum sp.]
MPAPLILAPEGPDLSQDEAVFFRETDPWGYIVFARHLEDKVQIRRLTDDLREAVGRDAPILVDQEGGRVQRMRAPLVSDWVSPLEDVQRHGAKAAQALYLRYCIIAAELLSLGIDVNCVPCLDIARPQTHEFLRNRCLGETRAQVTAMGLAVANGLLEGGVLPVIKHMPGHGFGKVDSHHDLPRTDTALETLEAEDFAPFAALSEMPLGMTAHLVFDALDPGAPATQSSQVITYIREEIGFGGLLMTDDISMNALAGDVVQRAEAAWTAGCEMVLHCNGDLAEMQALASAAPNMEMASKRRANAALGQRITPPPCNIANLKAQYAALSV